MSREPAGEARLVALLESLGPNVSFPDTPDLSSAVRASISDERSDERSARAPWFARPGFVVLVLGVVVVSLIAIAPARRAIADLLGVVGIRLEFLEGDDSAVPSPTITTSDPADLDLGRRVTREEARDSAGFVLRGPDARDEEAEIYFDPDIGENGMVSTLFPTPGPAPGYLVTEFEASVAQEFVKKIVPSEDVAVDYPTVGGGQGYWLSGAPHLFTYVDASGRMQTESIRLAGNVLLWSSGGITYRIEGAATLQEALRMAEAMGF